MVAYAVNLASRDRRRRAQVDSERVQLAAWAQNLSGREASAYIALQEGMQLKNCAEAALHAVAEYHTATMQSSPVRDRLRAEFVRLAFADPAAFRSKLAEVQQHSQLLPILPDRTTAALAGRIDGQIAYQDWSAEELRSGVRLNPHHPTPTGDSWAGGAEKRRFFGVRLHAH
jgi:hypothetical protein